MTIIVQTVLTGMVVMLAGTIPRNLLMAAPVAGVIEEAAFRGDMQGPIERRNGSGIDRRV